MEWEREALEKIKKVPIFARKLAMAKIERYATDKGKTKVTVEDVDEAKRAIFNKTGTDTKELVRFMRDIPAKEVDDKKKNLHEVSGCNENHLCPFSLLDARGLLQKLENLMKESNINSELIKRIEGPVVYHYAFRIAVAECPNACSQPQIKDFGVIVESMPGKGVGECINCNLCVQECKESAIVIDGGGPVIDYDRCVRCGACVLVCPVHALVTQKAGYSVLIGGRLGRHPKFAARVLEMVDEDAVIRALKAIVRIYLQKGEGNERFGSLIDRLGIEYIKKEIERRYE